jgi:hypothetical protein
LCALGATPNAEYHWNWHPELPRTALWAAVCAVRHLPLAEVLLEAGANPTDGVTVHIAGGGGNIAVLELLHRFGLKVNGIPGGVPPLVHITLWATAPTGPRWLLEHGADPNLPWGPDGEAPLHVAARRWDVPMVELLVKHGADRCGGDRTDAPRTRLRSYTETMTSRRRSSNTARRMSCLRSSNSSPPARAAIARRQRRC